MEAPTV